MPAATPASATVPARVIAAATLPVPWVMLGTFIVTFDFFAINVAVPTLRDALAAEAAQLQWVVASFGLLYGAGLIAGARLGERHGIERVFGLGLALFALASASLDAGRGWIAADGRLRSAIKAWWRGLKLLLRRPLAVLGTWLATTLLGLVLALLFAWLRGMVSPAGFGGFLLALLLGFGIAASLAWGRIARLYGMKALAEDAQRSRLAVMGYMAIAVLVAAVGAAYLLTT